MAVPSLAEDVKTVSLISTFVPVTLPFSLAVLGEGPNEGLGSHPIFKANWSAHGQEVLFSRSGPLLSRCGWAASPTCLRIWSWIRGFNGLRFFIHHHHYRRQTTNKTIIITANISNTIISIIAIMIIIILRQWRSSPAGTIHALANFVAWFHFV